MDSLKKSQISGLLLLVVAVISLSQGGCLNQLGPTPFRVEFPGASITLPLKADSRGFYVEAKLNESRPLKFYLDSGSTDTWISKRALEIAGIKSDGKRVSRMVDGKGDSSSVKTVNVVKLESAGFKAEGFVAVEMAGASAIETFIGEDFGGLLSLSVFGDSVVDVDFDQHKLTITRRLAYMLWLQVMMREWR